MSLGMNGLMARRVEPAVGNLMRVVAERNPFLPLAAVVERAIISERIGLLVGDAPDGMTLLYVWTHEDPGCLTWLINLAQWQDAYPAWRSAHGLPPCSLSLRVIVAAPSVVTGLRDALRLLVGSVGVVSYQCLDLDGKLVLGWESDTVSGRNERGERVAEPVAEPFCHVVGADSPDGLTPDERAFFQQLKN